jgi:hypothetical protein
MRRLLRSTALAILFAGPIPFSAPDIFVYKSARAEGAPALPDWIQASCCGPGDAHKLRVDQVHRTNEGFYRVDGYDRDIPASWAIPSQDGDYWIFYAGYPEGDTCSAQGACSHHAASQSSLYCFFVPMAF